MRRDRGDRTVTGSAEIGIIRRVMPYLWPADAPVIRLRVVLALVALVVSKLATVATPVFFKYAVDGMSGDTAPDAALALILGTVGSVVAYGVLRLSGVGFAQLRDIVFARVGQRALRALALESFRHVHALSLRYHLSRRTGAMNRILDRGVKGVEFLLRFLLFSIGPLVLELAMVAVVLWIAFDITYLLVVVLTIAVYVVYTFAMTERRVKIRQRMNDRDQEANQKAVDALLNFETVKYFGAETREAERYDTAMRGYERAALETNWTLAYLNFGQSAILTAGLVCVMVMAALGVRAGTLTAGDFVMVNAYMIQITMPLNFLGTVYREIRQALIDMRELFELLDQPSEVIDRPGAPPLAVSGGAVRFEDVHFGYETNREILHGLSLEVRAGQTVALVGPSGGGKSTVGRLLFRFYDTWSGRVSIDGQDLRDVTQESIRAAIGVVPQDTVLFNDTVGYNIAYGRHGATRAEVEEAARAARIHAFIQSLPEGYDTLVGERGLKLSGGEKQRVGIARTLLKNPRILLLDEATSALDTGTERGILESLREAGRGRTVITIAHRLSTVVHADVIVVIEAGRVVEQGTHEALMARGGRYAGMWRAQNRAETAAA
ncbi:ABC transporter ATP-binding protein/permease [Paroceanicella profunda]|uniref:ABC transporter ATP-binding protein/permease n=1 Tax=Paroceanicella profunda TaxID=2579971 RepID=A0A5B8FYE2_9RHOB|nr:ABC transporter ATP-binding protein/permease [Paroceanicella profunda]QDL92370.1 ABC transporter ATP-binding protein/permease [Paroceanicella profunda]